ncbi:hypothetical protein B0T49_15570 [Chromobacterium violaceum]|uniref:hypothetical protein n=1 Tax=Chromobacterium violaceum TaxID=536 RepID=UPI0009D9C269|nr:hypothetical protein [Chromobacterium violaceum]OQS47520.1 hypothetical protein B0T48_12640 [Chromobacterium violaceum]OQS48411.1 hypothetical protein B0T49_15570 [Chromobacterium violaceum]
MKIHLPSIADQQKIIFEAATKEAIATLQSNLKAPVLPAQQEVDEGQYSRNHLLREDEGWEPPPPDIIAAYFRHFQMHFPEYGTDALLGALLGLRGKNRDRRIRSFKDGGAIIPYDLWRRFLVITGRVPQDVLKVFAYMA